MARSQSKYVCQQCGCESAGWLGKCPNCGSWNSLVETVEVTPPRSKKRGSFGGQAGRERGNVPVRLMEVERKKFERVGTGISELDRTLGGGLVPGQVVLVAGEPGIGKSTLLLEVAANLAVKEKVLYVSGEESAEQVALRAERLGIRGEKLEVRSEKNGEIYLLAETNVDEVVQGMEDIGNLGLIIVDSIQTMVTEDLTGVAGSVGQVRECAARISRAAKAKGVPVFMVGHVTKEGTIAGPRVLEHLVDTVLWFEGSRTESLRIVRAIKNRFGPTDEAGVFEMREKGLVGVDNPSSLFLAERGEKGVSGSVVTCLLEGTRPLLVEVQALVVPSQLVMPRRVAAGVDFARLQVLVAVLTKRLGLPLGTHDVFVNVAGGLSVGEPAADLAMAVAIISAYQDKAVRPGTVVFGEVGLLGEVRLVSQTERREKEAKRLGFTNIVSPGAIKTLSQVVKTLEIGGGGRKGSWAQKGDDRWVREE